MISDEGDFDWRNYEDRQKLRNSGVLPIPDDSTEERFAGITVRCSRTSEEIIGPYFFDDENGVTETVAGEKVAEKFRRIIYHRECRRWKTMCGFDRTV
ncbi:hypothetical protein KM043_010302 [Ampulex compressa]|nr:hypothetical protein KM043_010302 [Ampulex compressa]